MIYQQAQLIVEKGAEDGDTRFALTNLPITIGRVESADIIINAAFVSRKHARLNQLGNRIVIEDLNSSNGVFVNGERIRHTHTLCNGDKIGLGPQVFLRITWQEETVVVSADYEPDLVASAPPMSQTAPAHPLVPPPALSITIANGATHTEIVTKDEITIGRGADNDVVIPAMVMSRQHLKLIRRGADYLVQFIPTAQNRPLLGKVPIADTQPLYDGDELVIGKNVAEHVVRLRYVSATAVPILPPPTAPAPPPLLTKEEIDSIVSSKNLLLRNLQITQGYYETAQMLGQFLGLRNVNWFAFGTYASKTAGRAIRHESLPRALKSALIRSAGYGDTFLYLNHVLANSDQPTTPENVLGRVLEQISLLLSLGNLMIFGELAWPFVDMINQFGRDRAPDHGRFTQFLDDHFIPGPFEEGGQDWLRDSLATFYEARFEIDNKRQTELIFLGNILLALHEQSRLQPVIEKALGVPFDQFAEGIIPNTQQEMSWFTNKVTNRAVDFSRDMVLRTVTRMMMAYTLPHREMKLGEDVVAPTDLISFPKELLTLENPRCREIIQKYDTGADTLSGSAANNWGRLDDRMRFIIDFFRSYQWDKRLYKPPFTPEQVSSIKAGLFPSGVL